MLLTILAVALVHLGVVISPGANFLVVSRNALAHSRQSGLVTARGVTLGSLFYIAIGVLGFATIIASSPFVFHLIQFVGAAYFLLTGIRTLLSVRRPASLVDSTADTSQFPSQRAFLNGLATSVSNPASALYFLALFTTFLQPSTPTEAKLLTALVLVTISFTWYTIIALTFSHQRVRLIYARFERGINALVGVLWIALALKLLTA